MRRSHLLAVLLSLVAGLAAGDLAHAGKKKGGKKVVKARKDLTPKADTRAVSELMGEFKWGMTPEEVQGVLGKRIDEHFQELVKTTSDAYQQDGFRKKAAEEKNRIKKSFVRFEGKKTGWDVSIIDKEFGQKNDESMFVYWENDPTTKKDQRRFFFFVDGKLWKMFIAFNAELFQGKTFEDFKAIMEGRYGKGGPQVQDGVSFINWRSPGFYLRAIDLTTFYGNFCIAISDDNVEQTILARREERNPKVDKASNITESVTEDKNKKDETRPPLDDSNSDVIDRMTGGGSKP